MALAHVEQDQADRRTGMVLVLLAGVLWSTIGLGIRLIEDAQVWQIMLYRSFALSAYLYIVIRIRSRADAFVLAVRMGPLGALGALGLVAAYSGGIYAIQNTTVANAMFLFATAPFMAAFLGWMVLGERVRRATLISVVAALIGIVVMVQGDADGAGGITATLSGNLAALAAAAGFAVFTVALRAGKATDMMPAVFLSGIFAIVITGTNCVVTGLPLVLSQWDAGIALSMGVLQVGTGLVLYTLGSRSVPAVELTLLSMGEVVLGPILVWLVLGEAAGTNTLIGGAIILSAIAANAISGARRRPPLPMG